ncbi:hypothetical protein Tco_1226824 [Tanacetum coccineum]
MFRSLWLPISPEFMGPWKMSGVLGNFQLCAIWKNLGYSEWSTPAGLKLARENLQSRVKEEDSITDVENAVFDLGVMDSLCFLFVDQRVFIGMITKFIKFIELNFSVITRGFDIKVCMLKGLVRVTLIARGASNLAKRDLRNLQTTRASLVGSAFALTHFDK